MVGIYGPHTDKKLPYIRMCNFFSEQQQIRIVGTVKPDAKLVQITFVHYQCGHQIKEQCRMVMDFEKRQFLISLLGEGTKPADVFPFVEGAKFDMEIASPAGSGATTIKVDGSPVNNPHESPIGSYHMFVMVGGDIELHSMDITPEPARQLIEKESRVVMVPPHPSAPFFSSWDERSGSLSCGYFHYLTGFGPGKRIVLDVSLSHESTKFMVELVSVTNRAPDADGFHITVPFALFIDFSTKRLFFCTRQAAQETNDALFAPTSDHFEVDRVVKPFPFIYDKRITIELLSTSNNFIQVKCNDHELGDKEIEQFDFELINLLTISQSFKLHSLTIEPEIDMFKLSSGLALKPSKLPISKPHTVLPDGSIEFEFAVVADQDTASKLADKKDTWASCLRKGKLVFNPELLSAQVEWGEDVELYGQIGFGGRAMELSELCIFNGQLLTVDDRTGLLYKIIDYKKLVPWVFLNDGDGNTSKGFKGEWMTVKGKYLYVGSHGRELTTADGEVINKNPMFVKTVTAAGEVRHVDWCDRFCALRSAAGIDFPGYVIHEAAQWSELHKKWFFLPRKACPEKYSEDKDPYFCANILLEADEDFCRIEMREIGSKGEGTRGFSAFQFLPGTNDDIVLAVKSLEIEGQPVESYLFMFRLSDGRVLLEDQRMEGEFKFEGLIVF